MPIIAADAKQLEWRTIIELSGDQTGLQEILQNQDTHALNQKAFELPSRLIAKIFLFRTIFRGSGYSFANDPDFVHVSSDPDFWDEMNAKFFKKYDGIDTIHKKWAKLCLDKQPIVSPLGREWLIPYFNEYKRIQWSTFTNYPVQGTGADIMMLARVAMARRIKANKWYDVKLFQTVHDDLKVDAPSEYVQPVCNLYHEVFAGIVPNIKKIFGYDWQTPLECEVKYGMNMKELTPIQKT